MRDFFRHGAIVAAGLIGANLLTYVYYALVARGVGVDRAGEFTSLLSAMVLLSLPANVIANIATKVVADSVGRGYPGTARLMMQRIDRWWMVFAVVAAVSGAFASRWIAGFFHVDDPAVVALAIAGFIFTFPIQPQRCVVQGSAAFVSYSASQLVEAGFKALAGCMLLLFGGGLRLAVGGYVLGVLGAFCYNAWWGSRQSGEAEEKSPSLTVLASLVGIALPIGAITMITFTDVIVVQHVFSRHVSGLYGAAALVGRAISAVVGFVFVVLLPKAASRNAAGMSSTRLLGAAMLAAGAILGTALVATGFFPVQVVTLLAGRSFAEAGAFLFPYSIAMSEVGLAAILASYLIALGRVWFGVPLACAAIAEVIVLATYHPGVWTVIYTVIAGHSAVLLCCIAGVAVTLVEDRRSYPRPERVIP
jgi:O-antigen/teichoic acid export membrane protein